MKRIKVEGAKMRVITLNEVIKAAKKYRESFQVNPGSGCVYTSQSGAHCLAGQILTDLGITVPTSKDKHLNTRRISSQEIQFFLQEQKVVLEDSAKEFLKDVQSDADRGLNWRSIIDWRVKA